MRELLKVVTPEEARARFAHAYAPRPRGAERVSVRDAYRRVLAVDITAPEDLPEFDKSTVDGYAVQSAATAAASAEHPVSFALVGEVEMGTPAGSTVAGTEAVRIPTGGMLPGGADAVVMLEDTVVRDGRAVEVMRRARPGDNVIHRAEDVRRGDIVLRQGTRLRPQDIGLLAGIGIVEVEVFQQPRVAILATGDEIIAPNRRPAMGQVRDINTYALSAMVQEEGGIPQVFEIIPDDRGRLLAALREARETADLVLVSGGSSVGEKDAVGWAIGEVGRPGVIVHGVKIKPGKPTILGLADGTPIIGLPGHPVSGMVIFDVFVRDVLRGLAGRTPPRSLGRVVRARMARPVPSAGGREDHVRVAVEERDGGLWAVPQAGKSGIVTTMTRADGLVVVPLAQAGLAQGAEVDVELFEP